MDTGVPPRSARILPFFPLINRDFTLLWSGQGISTLGDLVFDTTLVLWIATGLAHGQSWAPLAVSGVLLAALVPKILAGPWAGVFVDRWDKRRTMLATDALRAGGILCLLPLSGALGHTGSTLPVGWQLTSIYAVVVFTTLCSLFFGPARTALIGDVVPAEERSRASALGQMVRQLAALLGPPLAGPLYLGLGAGWALAVNAGSFALSFLLVAAVHAPPAARSVATGARGRMRREIGEGLRFYASNRVLVTMTVSAVILMMGGGALEALDVFFVTGTLHAPAALYGVMSAALGAGALIGAIAVSVWAKRLDMVRVFWSTMLLCALLIVVYSRLTSFVPALVVFFVIGIPLAALNVAVMPLMLAVTPRALIGRVSGVLEPAVSMASVAGIGLAGVLAGTVLHGFHAHLLGMTFGAIDTIYTAAGVLGLVAGVYATVGLRRLSPLQSADDPDAPPAPAELPA